MKASSDRPTAKDENIGAIAPLATAIALFQKQPVTRSNAIALVNLRLAIVMGISAGSDRPIAKDKSAIAPLATAIALFQKQSVTGGDAIAQNAGFKIWSLLQLSIM